MSYKISKQTEKKVLFAAPVKYDAPKFVATFEDSLVGVYDSEEAAIDACASHAAAHTRLELQRDLEHFPD